MNDSQSGFLAKIRNKLEDQKATLSSRIGELTKQDPYTDPERLNDNAASDQDASEESDHERVSALILELTGEVVRIDDALARIEGGTYGSCTNCGKSIESERLAVLPTATLCLACEHTKA